LPPLACYWLRPWAKYNVIVTLQWYKWAGTHRNGVPAGIFAAGTPFWFGRNQ